MALIDWLWFAVAAWDGNRCPYLSRHRFKGVPRLKIDGLRIGSDGFAIAPADLSGPERKQ